MVSGAGLQKTILDNIPYALGLVGVDGNIIAANRAWEQLRFLHPGCPLACAIGSNLLERIETEASAIFDLDGVKNCDELVSMMQRVAAGFRECIEFGFSCFGKGTKQWYSCFVINTAGSDDAEVKGAVIGIRDITSQVLYQERLLREKEESQEESRRKSLFLANLSHELRTPLNAILGFSDLMRTKAFGDDLSAKYLQFAENIYEGAEHLQHVVDRILSLVKLRVGHSAFEKEPVAVARIIEKAMRFVEPQFTGRNIVLDIQRDLSDATILGDKALLVQVIINLVSNALKYSPGDTDVWVKAKVESDGSLVLTVRDWGLGMDPWQVEKVKMPFAQVHESNSPGDGLGLGLPFSIGVVEMHGGALSIRSGRGKGTTVEVRLPHLTLVNGGKPAQEESDSLKIHSRAQDGA